LFSNAEGQTKQSKEFKDVILLVLHLVATKPIKDLKEMIATLAMTCS